VPTSKHSLKERLARYRQIKISANLATAASLPTHGFPIFPNDERNYH
jgi:hypothetical protein